MAQERRVLLANGQYITIVQTTGTSSGDVMSQSAVTAALSTKSDVGHTHNASAITGGTFGTNMIADGAITTTKLQDKSVTLAKLADDVPISTASYEIVKVSGLTSGGTAAIGAEVTIGGSSYKFDDTGVVSAQITYGQIYKIQAYSNDAWIGTYEATFTASTPSRSVSVMYVEPMVNGIFIEATNGLLYTSNEWSSTKTANSIVVAGDGIRFRIALTDAPSKMAISTDAGLNLENYTERIPSSATALSDYDGARNTANIFNAASHPSYAQSYCINFAFPNGKTKGFLPSLGQWNLAYQNKAAVEAALSACDGTTMASKSYWSSTFWGFYSAGARCCWNFFWGSGSTTNVRLDADINVRPFASY